MTLQRPIPLAVLMIAISCVASAPSATDAATSAASNATGVECAALAGVRIDDTNLLSSTLVPAGDGLPAYCRVLGYVRPAINFELRLPASWNSKLYAVGCGGFCGRLLSDAPGFSNAMNHGLKRGYAAVAMDGGHWGSGPADGRWAFDDRRAELDWAWRAVTETARVAKLLVRAHYGRPQQRAYFAGCSTGGRMALVEAERFPDDFDGFIAGAPALDYTGLVATQFAWMVQGNRRADGSAILSRDKVGAIAAAAIAACDSRDGAQDGLIDDPRRCGKFGSEPNLSALSLSAEEIGVLEKWYVGPRDSKGNKLYPGGVEIGSEPFWPLWLTGVPGTTNPPVLPLFARDFLRYMAFADDPGEGYEVAQFDFDRDPARLATMAAHYNADGGDLARFRDRGGKLIIYHGWSDPLVTPRRTVEYFETVERASGGAAATSAFARLFMLPGFDHCGIQAGPGANDAGFDPLPALEAWVEHGVAPDSILMNRVGTSGAVEWSRPVCAYPRVAKRRRDGDAARPEDYACVLPAD